MLGNSMQTHSGARLPTWSGPFRRAPPTMPPPTMTGMPPPTLAPSYQHVSTHQQSTNNLPPFQVPSNAPASFPEPEKVPEDVDEQPADKGSGLSICACCACCPSCNCPPCSQMCRLDLCGSAATCAPFIAELLGTFLLTVTYGCAFVAGETDPTGHQQFTPLVVGACVIALSYSLGPISGGHFNPAVTLCMLLCGKIRAHIAFVYILMQSAAAFGAACSVVAVFSQTMQVAKPHNSFHWADAHWVELFFTMMLCFVVANCRGSRRNNPTEDKNQFYGFAIGLVYVAAGFAGHRISGAVLNPAMSAAFDLSRIVRTPLTTGAFAGSQWFCIYQAIGALAAAVLFYLTRPEDFKAENSGDVPDYEPSLASRATAECYGAFMLALTYGLCSAQASPNIGIASAAVLMCMVYSIANISGAHFNPAVTLAVVLGKRGKCRPIPDGVVYATLQCLGALGAGIVCSHIARGTKGALPVGVGPRMGHSWGAVFFMEFFYTFVLCFTVLSVATVRSQISKSKHNFLVGVAIGLCVMVAAVCSADVSGGLLNPAVTLGLATEGSLGVDQMIAGNSTSFMQQAQWNASKGASGNSTKSSVASVKMPNTMHKPWSPGSDSSFQPHFLNVLWYSLFQLAAAIVAPVVFRATHPLEYYPKDFGSKLPFSKYGSMEDTRM